MQAWLECNDLFIRAKNALYGRALDLFDAEMRKGNIAVNGKFVKFEENEIQDKDEYLMLNMLQNKDSIIDFFEQSRKAAWDNAAKRLSGFIDDVKAIDRLVRLSMVFDDWAEEALLMVREKSAEALMLSSIDENRERIDAIAELLSLESSRDSSGLFSKEEIAAFAKTLSSKHAK